MFIELQSKISQVIISMENQLKDLNDDDYIFVKLSVMGYFFKKNGESKVDNFIKMKKFNDESDSQRFVKQ